MNTSVQVIVNGELTITTMLNIKQIEKLMAYMNELQDEYKGLNKEENKNDTDTQEI